MTHMMLNDKSAQLKSSGAGPKKIEIEKNESAQTRSKSTRRRVFDIISALRASFAEIVLGLFFRRAFFSRTHLATCAPPARKTIIAEPSKR